MTLRSYFLLGIVLLLSSLAFTQEICDNGIDDDNDGLIDLNDTADCNCSTPILPLSLIPNPSFEDTLCCPTNFSQMNCAEDWIQASPATSDYYNVCDSNYSVLAQIGYTPTQFPLPNGGSGFTGIIVSDSIYIEYIGVCLNGPMLAGTSYTLSFYTAYANGMPNTEITIFGTPNCSDLPWTTTTCPNGIDQWEYLNSQTINYNTNGVWQNYSITFTPTVDINAIAIGGPCTSPVDSVLFNSNYYLIDELVLDSTENFNFLIQSTGNICDNSLMLYPLNNDSLPNTSTFQWYLDGIALIGETNDTLNNSTYGPGIYSLVYNTGIECLKTDINISLTNLIVDFEFTTDQITYTPQNGDTIKLCLNDTIFFTNLSSSSAPNFITEYEWDFGNLITSEIQDTAIFYNSSGLYLINLDVMNSDSCTASKSIYISISNLNVDITNVIHESCENANDGQITLQNIYGSASNAYTATWTNLPNTIHDINQLTLPFTPISQTNLYAGNWQINLIDDFGCSWDTIITILENNSIDLTTNIGHPQCYNLATGSITAFSNSSGILTFSIEDSLGTPLNNNGTNTANALSYGTYIVSVTNGACTNQTTVELINPPAIIIDLDLTMPLCNGFETGVAKVDTIFNTQGNYTQISYSWDPNPNGNNGLFATSNSGLGAGEYILQVEDGNGCIASTTFFITEPKPLIGVLELISPTFCRTKDYQSGNGLVTVTTAPYTSGTGNVSYQWRNLSSNEDSPFTTFVVTEPGLMEATLTDANGCIFIDTIKVDSINPIANFTLTSPQFTDPNIYEGTEVLELKLINQSFLC